MVGCASREGVAILAEDPIEEDVDVTLSKKGDKCGIKTGDIKPESVYAKLSRRDKVKWHVHNIDCDTLKEVKFTFTKNGTANDDTHPFDSYCKKTIDDLKKGKTKTTTCQLAPARHPTSTTLTTSTSTARGA
jgi:hypothetical protein